MPRSYPAEIRRKVLDLVEASRPIQQVAQLLGGSDQTIYNWRRRLIDTGQAPGIPSSENEELITAPRPVSATGCHRSAAASSISAGDPCAPQAAAGPAGPTARRSQSRVSAHVAARGTPDRDDPARPQRPAASARHTCLPAGAVLAGTLTGQDRVGDHD